MKKIRLLTAFVFVLVVVGLVWLYVPRAFADTIDLTTESTAPFSAFTGGNGAV
ncbi:MAG: hypothetical protein LLG97_16440 [Deltaproteobacteria bacterium]|nr:hypothetical protein [Deltaproteobacteria bacterium]